MTIPRACLTCQFFSLSFGESGYSEMTPGSPASIDCKMEGRRGCAWPKRRNDYGEADVPTLITRAEKCTLYEPHEKLVSA